MVAPSSLILSDMEMGEQLTSTWVMLSSDLLRGWVPRRMASDFSGFKARPLWKNQEVRCTNAVSGRLTRSGSYFLIRRWKLGCHLHIVVGQPWTDWWQIEWGRWRKWTEWVQEPNLEERLSWAGLWRRHPDHISRIGPSETGRTQATLEHCHRHHTLSEVGLVKSSDQWCRRQHWGRVTQEAWIPPIGRRPSFV